MIFLARHGESVANTHGIYQGQTYDTPLSVLGKKQSRALSSRFANITFDKIFVSPLLRTRLTGEAVGKVILEPKIIETNHGLWEGKSKLEIEHLWPTLYADWFTHPSRITFPNGESFRQTQTRVINWWKEIQDTNECILVISHDNILRIIIAEVLKMNLDSIWQFHLHPAAISMVKNGQLVCLNDTRHLTELESNLSTHAL